MPQSNPTCALQLLSQRSEASWLQLFRSCAATPEACAHRVYALQQEKPPLRSPCTANERQRERERGPSFSATSESPCTATQTKNKYINNIILGRKEKI